MGRVRRPEIQAFMQSHTMPLAHTCTHTHTHKWRQIMSTQKPASSISALWKRYPGRETRSDDSWLCSAGALTQKRRFPGSALERAAVREADRPVW